MRGSFIVITMAVLGALSWPAAAQAPGSTFRDCAQCPEMVVVPAGSFTMGVTAAEAEREAVPAQFRGQAQPLTQVAIGRPFALGRYAVTRGEFAAFVAATGHRTEGGCYTWAINRDPQFQLEAARDWRSPGFPQTDRHPVVCVNWNDAQAFVLWLSQRAGKTYRLPSEAEWEYAARAGTATARFWGNARGDACEYANVADQTFARAVNADQNPNQIFLCQDGNVYTAPVGSYRPNGFALYDMLGNAWQWVEDCWNETYTGRPRDASAWLAGDCSRRVTRGGSWRNNPGGVRSGDRGRVTTGYRDHPLGFRVARTLTP